MLTGIYHTGRLLCSPPYIQVTTNPRPLHGTGKQRVAGDRIQPVLSTGMKTQILFSYTPSREEIGISAKC